MSDFGKLNFSISLNPTSAFPLDARCYFESLSAAEAAAATAEEAGSTNTVYYYGQKLVVVSGNTATWYTIQPDKTLKPDGVESDDPVLPSVTEDDDGKVLIVQNGEWAKADLPVYDGSYVVTPSADEVQTLYTSGKYNPSNITVDKIPYSEVSNSGGGKTVTIG